MTSDRAEHQLDDLLDRATTALRNARIPGGPSPDLVESTARRCNPWTNSRAWSGPAKGRTSCSALSTIAVLLPPSC